MGCSGVLWDVPGVFQGCSGDVPGLFRVLQTPDADCKLGHVADHTLHMHRSQLADRLLTGRFSWGNRNTPQTTTKGLGAFLLLLFSVTPSGKVKIRFTILACSFLFLWLVWKRTLKSAKNSRLLHVKLSKIGAFFALSGQKAQSQITGYVSIILIIFVLFRQEPVLISFYSYLLTCIVIRSHNQGNVL